MIASKEPQSASSFNRRPPALQFADRPRTSTAERQQSNRPCDSLRLLQPQSLSPFRGGRRLTPRQLSCHSHPSDIFQFFSPVHFHPIYFLLSLSSPFFPFHNHGCSPSQSAVSSPSACINGSCWELQRGCRASKRSGRRVWAAAARHCYCTSCFQGGRGSRNGIVGGYVGTVLNSNAVKTSVSSVSSQNGTHHFIINVYVHVCV